MIKKIKRISGETLIEALISILIAMLAMGFVSTATIAAANMNKVNRVADESFAKELEDVEAYMAGKEPKTMLIRFEDGSQKTIHIEVYGDGSRFASYKEEELP